MKHVLLLIMLLLASTNLLYGANGKVAMLLPISSESEIRNLDPDVKAAYDWFNNEYNSKGLEKELLLLGDVKDNSKINLGQYKVIWVYADGKANDELTKLFADTKLAVYAKNGGNLLLTGQATALINKIGRADALTEYSNGDAEAGNNYTWGITPILNCKDGNNTYDHSGHKLFNGLTTQDINSHIYYPLVHVPKQNHNSMWTNIDVPTFEEENNCIVLGTWQQMNDFTSAGVVEFLPKKDFSGRIIAIGEACYQWENNTTYINNVKQLTANGIDYLCEQYDNQQAHNTKVAYLLPRNLKEGESLDSDDETFYNAVDADDEKTALQWFKSEIVDKGRGVILQPKDLDNLDPNYITTMWVHVDRDNGQKYLIADWTNPNDIVLGLTRNAMLLKRYVKNGGNLLLTKHAVQLVEEGYIARSDCKLTDVENGNTTEDNEDMWAINAVIGGGYRGDKLISQNNYPCTSKPEGGPFDHRKSFLYYNMEVNSETYPVGDDGKTINPDNSYEVYQILGKGSKENHNCIWINRTNRTDDDGFNIPDFQKANNCTVLGTWGQHYDYSMAGVVDFKPGNMPGNVAKKDEWEGHIFTIGLGAYEWQMNMKAGGIAQTNPYLKDISQMTLNALNILEGNITEIDVKFIVDGVTYGGYTVKNSDNTEEHYATIIDVEPSVEKYDLVKDANSNPYNGEVTYHYVAYQITGIAEGAFTKCTDLAYADLTQYKSPVNFAGQIRGKFPANTLLYIPSNSSVDGTNIVNTSDADHYTCEHLRVYDKKYFANKYDFYTRHVSYSRNYSTEIAEGAKGNYKTTIAMPFAIDKDEAALLGTFYEYDGVKDGRIYYKQAASTTAYQPYMFMPKDSINYTKTDDIKVPAFDQEEEIATSSNEGGEFIVRYKKKIFEGAKTYNFDNDNKTYSIYAYKPDTDKHNVFVTTTKNITIWPLRVYLKTPYKSNSAKQLIVVFDDDNTTGISSLRREEGPTAVYDLQGRMVYDGRSRVALPKGMYIINHHKVIIK